MFRFGQRHARQQRVIDCVGADFEPGLDELARVVPAHESVDSPGLRRLDAQLRLELAHTRFRGVPGHPLQHDFDAAKQFGPLHRAVELYPLTEQRDAELPWRGRVQRRLEPVYPRPAPGADEAGGQKEGGGQLQIHKHRRGALHVIQVAVIKRERHHSGDFPVPPQRLHQGRKRNHCAVATQHPQLPAKQIDVDVFAALIDQSSARIGSDAVVHENHGRAARHPHEPGSCTDLAQNSSGQSSESTHHTSGSIRGDRAVHTAVSSLRC